MSMFRKPEEVKSGIKFLIYGATGTGKTTFALSAPSSVAIDTEDGMSRYLAKSPNLKYILTSSSSSDLEDALDEIEEELIDDIKTFILDSYTKIYENQQFALQSLAEKRQRKKGGDTEDVGMSVRDWGKLKLNTKKIQATQLALSAKGVNIINIAQESDIKEKRGENWVIVGHKPDLSKGVEFDYDVILRFTTEDDKKNKSVSYKAEVLKDRTGTFNKYDVIDNPTFSLWDEVYTKTMSAKESNVNFKKDVAKDIAKEETESASAKDISDKIKAFIKGATDEQKKKISKTMQSLEINIKDLASNPIESLNEVSDLIDTF